MPGKDDATSAALVKVDASGHSIDVGQKDLEILSRITPRLQDLGAGLGAISRTNSSKSIAVELSVSKVLNWRYTFTSSPYNLERFLLRSSILRESNMATV